MKSQNTVPHSRLLGDLQIIMHAIVQQKAVVQLSLQWTVKKAHNEDLQPKSWMFFAKHPETAEASLESVLALHQYTKEFGSTLSQLSKKLSDFDIFPKLKKNLKSLTHLYTTLPFIDAELTLLKTGGLSLENEEVCSTLLGYLDVLDQLSKTMSLFKESLFEEMVDSVSIACRLSSDDENPSLSD